jgi:transposase InsO family protein
VLRSDNGECCSNQFEDYLKSEGIVHERTAPYTPEDNGIGERMNRTVFEGARAIVHTAGLPKEYWGEAVITTVHVYNRIGHPRNAGKSPFEIIMGKPQNVSHIRTFGERCWYLVNKNRKKMDPKSREAILLGYVPGSSAYRLQDVETKRVVFTRNVRFDGHIVGQH